MAAVAVIHVFVSHFAIGGGLYLVVAETLARRNQDKLKLDFLKGLSRFFILVTLVFGALTGVGIWFSQLFQYTAGWLHAPVSNGSDASTRQ